MCIVLDGMGRVKGGAASRSKWQRGAWQQDAREALESLRREAQTTPSNGCGERRRGNYGLVVRQLLNAPSQAAVAPALTPVVAAASVDSWSELDLRHSTARTAYRSRILDARQSCTGVSDLIHRVLVVIAENIGMYDAGSLAYALSSCYASVHELLCCLMLRANTLDDASIRQLSACRADTLLINRSISTAGLVDALSAESEVFDNTRTKESWEDADEIDDPCLPDSHLRKVLLIDSRVSLLGAMELLKPFASIEQMTLHNTRLSPSVACAMDVLSALLHSFKRLNYLEVSYCEWLSFSVLEHWLLVLLDADCARPIFTLRVVGTRLFQAERQAMALLEIALNKTTNVRVDIKEAHLVDA